MLGIGIALFAVVSPTGLADRFTTFDFGEASTQSSFGNFHAEHEVLPANGLINLYADAVISGGADVVGRVGATYILNSGDLLSPFSAFTTTEGVAVGELACLNIMPGTAASLSLTLQKWHLVGETWIVEQVVAVDEWRCPLVTLVDFEIFSGGTMFSYDPGETYRLVVEALAKAQASNGSEAITDFCDANAFDCGSLTIPGHIIIDEIVIPNQRPVALFHDTEVWFVDALLNGAVVTGRACDIDGTVTEIVVGISELLTNTTTPVGGICADGQHIVHVVAPGTFTGNAAGRDDENVSGSDVGVFRVSILPPVQSGPVGFPDLAMAQPRSTATLETTLSEDGVVLAYRLLADGLVVADTTHESDGGTHAAVVSYDLLAGRVSVTMDGEQRWSGHVRPVIGARGWWDVEPVLLPEALQPRG